MKKAGYTVVDPGRYENLTNDYSAQISRFKSADTDILTGVPLPPDFTKFYKQAAQQGYHPKAATIAKAILFPAAVEALGPLAEGLTSEVWWTPTHPFKSSITGQSAKELADAYSESSNKQWTQPIGYVHALFEVAKDVLGRASDPKDKGAVAEAIKATSLDTIVGPLSWSNGPVPNVAKTPLVGGQWTKGTDYPWDLVVVRNTLAEQIPTAGKVKAISA
jgi:branched-chain amino acid transport system substrate-binding protein